MKEILRLFAFRNSAGTGKRALVDADDHLQVDVLSNALPSGAATEVTLSAINAKLAALGQTTMAGSVPVVIASDQSTLPISVSSLPLPFGAATSAKQDTIIGHIDGVETALGSILTELQLKADLTETQPVSVASLPLPSGAATAVNQATQITALQLIDDVVHSANAAFGKAAAIAGQFDDTTTVFATDKGIMPVRISEARGLHTMLVGDDGTPLDWGGSGPANSLGVLIAGEKSGGGFQYLRAESNPVSGEIGLNVNLMQYGETNGDLDTGPGTDNRLVTGIIGAASGGGQFIPGTSADGLLVNLGANNDVTIAALPLPAGAATEATLADVKTAVQLIDDAVSGTGFNISQLAGAAVPIGAGLEATALRVTLPTDGTGVVIAKQATAANLNMTEASASAIKAAVEIMDDWDESDRAKVNPIAGQAGVQGGSGVVTALTQRVVLATDVALPAGTNAIGKLAANSGVDIGDVDILSIAAGSNAIGNVGIIPRTSGGLSLFRSIDLDETEEDAKASAGQLFGWYFYNSTASAIYVKIYNSTAASVTVGTTTPVLTIPVPAYSAANAFSDIGIAFSTGICLAATTGVADSDTGAPAANALIANVFYS